MRGIFDDAQIMPGGNPVQGVHIDRQPREMHRHDGARLGGDGRLDQVHVQIPRLEIDIDEYRLGAHPRHHIRARGKAHRRNDDLVALPDTGDLERHLEPRRRRGHHAHVAARTQISGERRLEGHGLWDRSRAAPT